MSKPELLMQKEIGEFLDYVEDVHDKITSEYEELENLEDEEE